MKVLATGAVGFLESHLCERPIQPGRDIACLDNFVTGPRETFGTLMDPGGSGCCATTSARCSCSKWTGSITGPPRLASALPAQPRSHLQGSPLPGAPANVRGGRPPDRRTAGLR